MTGARRRALDVLLHGVRTARPVRESNETSLAHLLVYWQTARWLEGEGYCTIAAVSRELVPTDQARQLAAVAS